MSKQSNIAEIKAKLSLVDIAKRYMELRRVGGRWTAPCPFHQEAKPSFSINEEEGLFYCFGCQASGDLIDFYSKINGLDFKDTITQLAEEAGVKLVFNASAASGQEDDFKRTAFKLNDLAGNYFIKNLQAPRGEACKKYVVSREISPEMAEKFGLGYSFNDWHNLESHFKSAGYKVDGAIKLGLLGRSERTGEAYDRFRNRLMFPIKNLSGRIVAFGGRILPGEESDEQAKYINSSDSPIYKKGEHLYGLFEARRAITHHKAAILTEGYLDVISLHQFGFENACGVLGTALTAEQVKRLSGFCSRIDLVFDGDAPGQKAAMRSAEMILAAGLNCSVVILPNGEDIDSLLKARGAEDFKLLLKEAQSGVNYCINTLKNTYAPKEIVEWLKGFLQKVEVHELKTRFISEFALPLSIDEAEIRGQMLPQRVHQEARKTPMPGWAHEAFAKHILAFVIRFPQHAAELDELNCSSIMCSTFTEGLWSKILNSNEGDVFLQLSDEEKVFWTKCKAVNPLPDNVKDQNLEDIKLKLASKAEKRIAKTYKEMLRQHGSGEGQNLEILRVINIRKNNE